MVRTARAPVSPQTMARYRELTIPIFLAQAKLDNHNLATEDEASHAAQISDQDVLSIIGLGMQFLTEVDESGQDLDSIQAMIDFVVNGSESVKPPTGKEPTTTDITPIADEVTQRRLNANEPSIVRDGQNLVDTMDVDPPQLVRQTQSGNSPDTSRALQSSENTHTTAREHSLPDKTQPSSSHSLALTENLSTNEAASIAPSADTDMTESLPRAAEANPEPAPAPSPSRVVRTLSVVNLKPSESVASYTLTGQLTEQEVESIKRWMNRANRLECVLQILVSNLKRSSDNISPDVARPCCAYCSDSFSRPILIPNVTISLVMIGQTIIQCTSSWNLETTMSITTNWRHLRTP